MDFEGVLYLQCLYMRVMLVHCATDCIRGRMFLRVLCGTLSFLQLQPLSAWYLCQFPTFKCFHLAFLTALPVQLQSLDLAA